MFKLFAILVVCVSMMGCLLESDYPSQYQDGTVTFCDDYGCRDIHGRYYYDANGSVVYYDEHFGYWVGPHGYWLGTTYRSGYWGGYHGYYHRGFYQGSRNFYRGGGYNRGGGHRR